MSNSSALDGKTPEEGADREPDDAADDPRRKKPRLASIVREVEAAVRELEEPPAREE